MASGEPAQLVLDPEMEFLASKEDIGHEWELYKENVRPLKRGRDVRLLNLALKSHADPQLRNSLLQKRRKLIEAIDEYKGDDPLQPWIQCIKWVQEAFPPGGDCSGLVVIYEQCVRTFWNEDRYKEDLRFLNVWLEYAENCADSEVIFSFLIANKIGVTHAVFYISFALYLESKNKIKTADDIFNRGLAMEAKPLEKLKATYKKFLTRSMMYLKVADDDEVENHHPPRSFGTVLAKQARNQSSEIRDLMGKKQKLGRASGSSTFSIFKENSNSKMSSYESEMPSADIKPFRSLGARAERNKENNPVPSKWTSNKIPQKSGHRAERLLPGPCIQIFVDQECSEEHEQKNKEEKLSILKLRPGDGRDIKKETEMLRENPLRNFPVSSLPR